MSKIINNQNGPLHLSDTNAYKWEVQRTNHFEIEFDENLEGGRDLALAVNMFSLPNIANDPIEVARQNSRIKYAGQAQFTGAESLEVIDYIGADIEAIVNNWRLKVYDPENDRMGLAANYKCNAWVKEYAPDHTQVRVWRLIGVWPSSVAFGDSMSMDGSEVKKITLTLSYDRGYRDYNNDTVDTSLAGDRPLARPADV
jgi:hypothetical protein